LRLDCVLFYVLLAVLLYIFSTQCNIATVKCKKPTFFALTRTYRSFWCVLFEKSD